MATLAEVFAPQTERPILNRQQREVLASTTYQGREAPWGHKTLMTLFNLGLVDRSDKPGTTSTKIYRATKLGQYAHRQPHRTRAPEHVPDGWEVPTLRQGNPLLMDRAQKEMSNA